MECHLTNISLTETPEVLDGIISQIPDIEKYAWKVNSVPTSVEHRENWHTGQLKHVESESEKFASPGLVSLSNTLYCIIGSSRI